ncbi:MAG: class B sortase [Lachnospiraceae bacterium]|nr:class B sortase [Lachnospiraceae bacterium]
MKNNRSKRIALAVCIFVSAISMVALVKMIFTPKYDVDQYKTTTVSVSTEVVEPSTTQIPDNPINFKKLKKKNSDIHAWINIPGTDIDYPVAQSSYDEDDNFYLNHGINKKYEFAGTIYTQKLNSIYFKDPVTVLYGHNMLNGTMFAQLHKFKDPKFFKKHDTIYIYIPKHILTYKIVSAYIYDDRHILNTFNFNTKKGMKAYVKSINNPKSISQNVREDFKAATSDKIITLSTCTSVDSQRYLVQGVLINDETTN